MAYAVLGTATDNKERNSRDFSIFHSLLERKFINNPKTSFCSLVQNPKEFSFCVISEYKEVLQELQEFASKYFASLVIAPNVTLTLTTSPYF